MARNLHIAYDLNSPGQNYPKVESVIKSLGNWARVNETFWYVDSHRTASQACDAIWAVMDKSDTIYVVDATNNEAAWYNVSATVEQHLSRYWHA